MVTDYLLPDGTFTTSVVERDSEWTIFGQGIASLLGGELESSGDGLGVDVEMPDGCVVHLDMEACKRITELLDIQWQWNDLNS